MQAAMRVTRRKGFSIVELAIVFCVIGVLVGGLWAVGSTVSLSNTLNQASNDLHVILNNARAYYAGQNSSYTALNAAKGAVGHGGLQADPSAIPSVVPPITTNDFTYYSDLLSAAAVFPVDMATQSGGVLIPNNLGTAQIALACTQISPGNCGDPVRIVIRYTNIKTSAVCAALVSRNSMPEQTTGLNQVVINGATLPNLPGHTTDIATLCGVAGPYTIDWYYTMG